MTVESFSFEWFQLLNASKQASKRKNRFAKKRKEINGKMNYRSVLRKPLFVCVCVCLRELMKMNEKYNNKNCMKIRNLFFFSSILWAVAFSVIRACFARERAATAFGRNEMKKKTEPSSQRWFDRNTHMLCARWTSHLLGCRWSSFVSVYTFLLWVRNRSLNIFRKRLDKRTKRRWWRQREREKEKNEIRSKQNAATAVDTGCCCQCISISKFKRIFEREWWVSENRASASARLRSARGVWRRNFVWPKTKVFCRATHIEVARPLAHRAAREIFPNESRALAANM